MKETSLERNLWCVCVRARVGLRGLYITGRRRTVDKKPTSSETRVAPVQWPIGGSDSQVRGTGREETEPGRDDRGWRANGQRQRRNCATA